MRLRRFTGLVPSCNDAASQLVSPPYDTVSESEARSLLEKQPSSFIGVVRPDAALPPGATPSDTYAEARRRLDFLIENHSLVKPIEPAMYVYELNDRRTNAMEVATKQRQRGIVALVSVHDYDEGVIKKHEKTRPEKVDDRTQLGEVISAQTGPVFLTYRDVPTIDEIVLNTIASTKPTFDLVADDDVRHRVWSVADQDCKHLIAHFNEKVSSCYIADGHHRAASAARIARRRLESRLASARTAIGTEEMEESWFLAALFPETQLTILPYNRLVHDLNGYTKEEFLFKLASVGDVSRLAHVPTKWPDAKGIVYIFVSGEWYQLTFSPSLYKSPIHAENLDCSILQDTVLSPLLGINDPRTSNRIEFVGGIRGYDQIESRVRVRSNGAAFVMFPVTIDDLIRVSDDNCLMPPKSTWFEPKLRSGFFIHTFD